MIMETKINIAEILRDKPENTKLYSLLFGDVYLSCIQDSIIKVTHHGGITKFFNNGRYYNYPESEQVLFPSKEMRDWSKFSWRKGDVLTNSRGVFCIFKEFSGYPYTTFIATFVNNVDFVTNGSIIEATQEWNKASNENAEKYIGYITADLEKANRRLNLETLEIEKLPEFKDGDIVVYGKSVAICRKIYKYTHCFYVSIDETFGLLFDYNTVSSEECRFAKEEEKQQLFDALAKEGKAWDAEKKMIVNLKPKIELKPFDKVLVKDNPYGSWEPALFWKKVDVKDLHPYMIIGGKRYRYCEPYEGNEHLLGKTNNVEG